MTDITKLVKNIESLQEIDKINEIIDAVNTGASIDIDSEMSSSSENPVQNKVITSALEDKQDALTAGAGINITNNTISVLGNYSYSVECPALTPVDGIVTWQVTHNLGTQNVVCSLFYGTREVDKRVIINSNNALTLTFQTDTNVSAGDYKVIVLSSGGLDSNLTYDGNWTTKYEQIFYESNIPSDSEEVDIDFSSYLPNDSYDYEVFAWFSHYRYTNQNNTQQRLQISTDFMSDAVILDGMSPVNATENKRFLISNTLIVPIGQSRKISITPTGSWSAKGDVTVRVYAYRRLGNNLNLNKQADPNYIPANTVIKVELDGSGDFTTLAGVLGYLNNKWSNGRVTIQLGEGTFEITSALGIASHFDYNIPFLWIRGTNKNTSIIKLSNSFDSNWGISIHWGGTVMFENLTYQGNNNNKSCAIQFLTGSVGYIQDVNFKDLYVCLLSQGTSRLLILGTNTFSNFMTGWTAEAGYISTVWNSSNTFTNPASRGTALLVTYGGQIHVTGNNTLNNTNCAKSNITTNGGCNSSGYVTW